ncbi:MAG: hypothetical protein CVU54_14710 [Deltaproteobacteria bacterium HGW-Deltaproteobacteria-12]|jgi:hypothetical protein|nr:MAG: hypothetical protein CVU54_14710 [Deltaproteobacteria bacterium HGW-Deltaproteobacteria-12]
MKTKLIELGLTENIVAEILSVFDNYEQVLKRYSKPKGRGELQRNMKEIEKLSEKLKKRLDKISVFEQQHLNRYCSPKIFDLKSGLIRLTFSCQELNKTTTQFSKREPLILSLTMDLWKILERNGIAVKKYKNNMLCKVLNTLLPESKKPRKHKKDESDVPESDNDWAFHLLREASKHISKS